MSAAPNPTQPAMGRRMVFLGICLFGYALLMAGWWLANKSGKAGGQTPVTILVAPFANTSDDSESKQAALHLAPDLIAVLLKNQALRIVSAGEGPPASEQAARDLGKKMKANAVLTGSVSKVGERVRIAAQLVDCETGYHVWEHTYQQDPRDGQVIAEVVAKGIVDALQGKRQ